MKKYICLALFLIMPLVNGQNYFPMKAGDIFQIRNYEENETISMFTSSENFSKVITEEITIGDKNYIKFSSSFFRFDSLENKLYGLINSEDRLLFDFNKPAGSKDTLYWRGYSGVFTYSGVSTNVILGKSRKTVKVNFEDPFEAALYEYTFAEDIGFLESYVFVHHADTRRIRNTIVSAIMQGIQLSPVTLKLSPQFPAAISRKNSEASIKCNISASFISLVNFLNAEVIVFKDGSIKYSGNFAGSVSGDIIKLKFSDTILSDADSIGIKITCKDSSIFYNSTTYPTSGYYYVKVVDEIRWNNLYTNLGDNAVFAMKFTTPDYGFILSGRTTSLAVKYETTDGGFLFNEVYFPGFRCQDKNILMIDSKTGYLVGDYNNGDIFKTTDGGKNWNTVLHHFPQAAFSISFISKDTGWVSATALFDVQRKLVYRTLNGGSSWDTLFLSGDEYLKSISFININTGWGLTPSGKLYKTENSGVTWEQISVLSDQDRLKMFDENRGWIIGSGIFRTTDGGVSWIKQADGNFRDAEFFNPDTGWVMGENLNGKQILLYTNNGGTLWESVNTGTKEKLLFMDFTDPLHGWILCEKNVMLKTNNGGVTFIEDGKNKPVVSDYYLFQNYPNPFNPATSIQYHVAVQSFVSLKVYDVLGNEIGILVSEEKPAGIHEVNFNAKGLSSGVYFYRLDTGQYQETKKMILLR